jgi:hypothetical protein
MGDDMFHVMFGALYLTVALCLTMTIVSRLWEYWSSFVLTQKLLLGGLSVIMVGFTQRGIELIWFDAPGPRPAAYIAVCGALLCLVALLLPVDPRLQPTWQQSFKQQEPANYDRYMEILAQSQTIRKLDEEHDSR